MHYTSFQIQNFKGIRDTTIKLSRTSKTGVFAFVGLNESGKTTILEAIHSFAPDPATSELVGGEPTSGVPIRDRVPRHLLSNFTGEVSVIASLKLEGDERAKLDRTLRQNPSITLDPDSLPEIFEMKRTQRFLNGDLKGNIFFS